MTEVRLTLPLPPSANNLFPTNWRTKKRYVSSAYAAWKLEAGWSLQQQRPGKIVGPYELDITVPMAMRGDISNRVKAIEDLLVAHRVTMDDKGSRALGVSKSAILTGGYCEVLVMPWKAPR